MTSSDDHAIFEAATYRFEEPAVLRLTTWLGDAVDLSVHEIDVDDERVDVDGQTSWAGWQAIRLAGALHLDLADFHEFDDAGRDVRIEILLRTPYQAVFDSSDELVAELFDPDGSPLHSSDAWLICSASQSIPIPGQPDATTEVGFRTEWAAPFT